MAWNTKWRVAFASITGGEYYVDIKRWDYSGSIINLTPSATPLVTQEQSDSDPLIPIREQTATIGIVTNDSSLLLDISPDGDLETLVEVTDSIEENTYWVGFLQQRALTQPIDNGYNTIKLKATSLVGCLESVVIPEEYIYKTMTFAEILQLAWAKMRYTPSHYNIINDLTDATAFLNQSIRMLNYFSESTVQTEVYTNTIRKAKNIKEVISDLCTLHGLVLRDANGGLAFVNGLTTFESDDTKFRIVSLTPITSANPITVHVTCPTIAATVADSRGDDNTLSFNKAEQGVLVTVKIENNPLNLVSPIRMNINSTDTLHDISIYGDDNNNHMLLQFPAINDQTSSCRIGNSVFQAYKNEVNGSGFENVSISEAMDHIVALNPTQRDTAYGWALARPCVYRLLDKSSFNGTYGSGIYLNLSRTNDYPGNNTRYVPPILTITSDQDLFLYDGYLAVYIKYYAFVGIYNTTSQQYVYRLVNANHEDLFSNFNVKLRIGNQGVYGDIPVNPTWVDNYTGDCSLTTNNDETLNSASALRAGDVLPSSKGAFVGIYPRIIGEEYKLKGQLSLQILAQGNTLPETIGNVSSRDDIGMIITDLSIKFYPAQRITDLDLGENKYIYPSNVAYNDKDIHQISLELGTYKGNTPSYTFLIDGTGAYITSCNYTTAGTTSDERPEDRLLAQASEHYMSRRKRMEYECLPYSSALTTTRIYSDGEMRYLGFIKKIDWRNSKHNIEFIEMRNHLTSAQ
jgi:hypothetical protein